MSSGFVTESEAAEARKKRQEEWEKVRKADDPLERPEEPYDSRSLFERLQEQKQKKDLEYEEAHKLKNMIKGLDDDEIEFLDLVDRTKLAADRKKNIEEELELNDYRNRVATLQEKCLDQKLQAEIVKKPKGGLNRSSQMKLLKGVVVKKPENGKRKRGFDEGKLNGDVKENGGGTFNNNEKSMIGDVIGGKNEGDDAGKESVEEVDRGDQQVKPLNSSLQCIGILPGLGCYYDSSSDGSSTSDQDESPAPKIHIDLLGRKMLKKEKSS